MRYLRTNTATRVGIGPFLDKTDGVTPEVAITVTSCKLTMTVDDGGVPTLVLDTAPTASGGANDMVHITGDDAGMYDLELAAANVNYLGRAKVIIADAATHCPVWEDFMILPAMIYDSLVLGTDRLDANITHAADVAWGSGAIVRAAFAADTGLQSIRSNTAQAGAATTITLDASASAVNSFYLGNSILLTGGTGVGQFRTMTGYVGATKVATVDSAWATNPDNTTTFAIFPAAATVADVADGVWDELIGDSTITARQAMKLFVSALAGIVSGAGTTTITFKNVANDTSVIVATVDSSGNRSAVTLTL